MMSQSKIEALLHQYRMAYFTPVWCWVLLFILCVCGIVGICIWEHRLIKSRIVKLHPHADAVTAWTIVGFVVLAVFGGVMMILNYNNNKATQTSASDYKVVKLCYANRAFQYKKRIPKQKKQLKQYKSFTTLGRQRSLKSKINWEEKFYKKYSKIKGIHGPKRQNYTTHLLFVYTGSHYQPSLNRYHFTNTED